MGMLKLPAIQAQSSSPKFEVASVKAGKDAEAMTEDAGPKGGSGVSGSSSPDRRNLPCRSGNGGVDPAGAAFEPQIVIQALLEDRFQLSIHRETREVPLYALLWPKAALDCNWRAEEVALPGIPRSFRCRRLRPAKNLGVANS